MAGMHESTYCITSCTCRPQQVTVSILCCLTVSSVTGSAVHDDLTLACRKQAQSHEDL